MGYIGFKALEGKLSGKVNNPGAVAASIGRKKYGAKKFQKAAAAGRKLGSK
jgi:membrane carboxypeptidase/penicillin-binding protein